MRTFKWKVIRKQVCVLFVTASILSCAKDEDPLITYEGKVLTYQGPYLSDFHNDVDESNLSSAAGVTVKLYQSGPCGFGHCGPEVEHHEMTVTDAEGNYSFVIRSKLDGGYYPRVEFPENIEYSKSDGGYDDRKVFSNRVVFVDIILVDNQ